MSLRTRLFLMFGGLIGLVMVAQWQLTRLLAEDILKEFGFAAMVVGRDVSAIMTVQDFQFPPTELESGMIAGNPPKTEPQVQMRVETLLPGEKRENHWETIVFSEPREGEGIQAVNQPESTHGIISQPRTKKTANLTRITRVRESEQGAKGEGEVVATWESASGMTVEKRYYKKQIVSEGKGEPNSRHVVTGILEAGPEARILLKSQPDLQRDIMIHLDNPQAAQYLFIESPQFKSRIPLPKDGMSTALGRLHQVQLLGSVLIFLGGLLIVALFAHRESMPLRSLADAAHHIGSGKFGFQVQQTAGGREIRQAVHAFNAMSLRLSQLDRAATQARQKQYLSELGEIARGLAHNIRNPLNTLGLSVEQLGAMVPNARAGTKLVDNSRRQIRRIDQWIRSFLSLANEGRAEAEALQLGGLIQDVVLEALQDNRGKARIRLEIKDKLPSLRGVTAELRSVVQALIVNAVEANPPDSEVLVTAALLTDGLVRIEVMDEGPGLAEEVRKRLFMPHVTTKINGSGMGLFLAHRIVTTRYRGNLTLEPRQPSGVLAILELPLRNDYDEDPNPTG